MCHRYEILGILGVFGLSNVYILNPFFGINLKVSIRIFGDFSLCIKDNALAH